MGSLAHHICLLLFASITAVASVTILGSGQNTLVAVLIGRITNKTLDDLKTHIGSLQIETQPLDDFSNVQQDNLHESLHTAVQKLTSQYTSIASQVQSLQMTIDSQSKMHQEAIAVQLKLLEVLKTQSKMIEMIDKKSKTFEEAVTQSNSNHSKMYRLIEEQSQKQQKTIDTQSNMVEMLRKIDAQATDHQNSIDTQLKNIDAQQSKIITNQSKIRGTQYETIQLLESIETQSKHNRESIDSQLKLHQAIADTQLNKTIQIIDTQAQMLEDFDVQSQNLQKSSDTQAKIVLMMDSQSETLQYIDTQLGDHQANIRSQISQMIEEQSEKLQAVSDKQSEMQQTLENIDGQSESRESTLKLLELLDKHSNRVQRSINALSTDTEDKVNRMGNYVSQIFEMLQNINYQARGQQIVPVAPWKMPGSSQPQMSGHTFQTRSENSHMSIGVRSDRPNPDWMYG